MNSWSVRTPRACSSASFESKSRVWACDVGTALPPASASPTLDARLATPTDDCFWLYSSGSTGRPKGAVHLQRDMVVTSELYGVRVLGVTESDICYSAAKLFFAYGLGNAMTFPLWIGGTAVLDDRRPTPDTTRAGRRPPAATRPSSSALSGGTVSHFTSSSTQSKVRVTAFFQSRYVRSRSAGSIAGIHRLSSAQLSMTSCSPFQNPTAMPAA